jgi:hypothetical protein
MRKSSQRQGVRDYAKVLNCEVSNKIEKNRTNRLDLIGQFELTQNEFVDFLRTGMSEGYHITQKLKNPL